MTDEINFEFDVNRASVIEFMREYRDRLPRGLSVHLHELHCEIRVCHPGIKNGIKIGYTFEYQKQKNIFAAEFDHTIAHYRSEIKRYNKTNLEVNWNKERQSIKQCESNAVNGKCSCGYSLTGRQMSLETLMKVPRASPNATKSNDKYSDETLYGPDTSLENWAFP
jgi:hypothetical protein